MLRSNIVSSPQSDPADTSIDSAPRNGKKDHVITKHVAEDTEQDPVEQALAILQEARELVARAKKE